MENRFIAKLHRLHEFDEQGVAALAAATSKPRKVAARQDLIREGDRPGPVFVVLQGWAIRYKIMPNGARQILAYLMPGDCCDPHIGLLAEMDHSIQTITPALIAVIERPLMDQILADHPGVAKAIYIAQLIDEGTMRAWIASMGRRSSVARVAHLICELYLRARMIGHATGDQFELPVSQLLLADSLGMTPVHLNRVLKDLRGSGSMVIKRGSVLLTDPVALVQIAGFDENYLHRRSRLMTPGIGDI